jgi:hypothetical protein
MRVTSLSSSSLCECQLRSVRRVKEENSNPAPTGSSRYPLLPVRAEAGEEGGEDLDAVPEEKK